MNRKISHLFASFIACLAFCLTPLASAAAPDTDLFGQLRAGYDAAISPDGTRVALIRAIDGEYVVLIVALDGSAPDETGAVKLGEGSKPRWIKWVNDDRVFVSLWRSIEVGGVVGYSNRRVSSRLNSTASGSSRATAVKMTSIFTMDADTLEGRILFSPNGFRQFNDEVLDWLEDDPDHILMQFAGDGGNQIYPDVRKVDVVSGADRVVHNDKRGIADWITTTDGRVIAGSGYTGSSGTTRQVIVRDPESGRFEDISDYEGLNLGVDIVSGFPDMERLVVRAYRDQDTRGLHIYDLAAREFTETIFQNDTFDARNPIFSADGTKIVGATYASDVPVRTLLPGYGEVLRDAEDKLEGYSVQLIDQSADGQTILIRVSNPYDPGGIYVYKSGQPFALLTPNYPGLEPQSLGNVVSVRYTTRDGTKIPA
jgi:dipeptidyl aminopeptidase/acylaminoacyl peptidase